MLNGERPKECNYCWDVEDNSNMLSDRIFKSEEPWSQQYFDEIKNLNWRENYNPKYVEVSFSNTCNFKCSYCGPMFSSKWMEEIERYGKYPTSTEFGELDWLKSEGKIPYRHSEHNPYVEAFWDWWPNLYQDLHTFRITGGEPLLSKDTWNVLDYIIKHPSPNTKLNLSINSNLGVPKNLIDRLIEKLQIITDKDLVNEMIIYTSLDGWGEQAEYIRYGLEFNSFWDNVNKILEKIPKVTIVFMSTYNALSVFSFRKLLKNLLDLRKEYKNPDRYWLTTTPVDASYLRYPPHQTVKILEPEHKNLILKQAEFVVYNLVENYDDDNSGFNDIEVQKIKRIYDWSLSEDEDLTQNRIDFVKFVDEHDLRRGTNFLKTFPEMEDFYYKIKNKI
jgi:sulfatase maturation enzyme AslB (radical SAM superfamily)